MRHSASLQRGLTLIEVMVTLLIFTIGLMGLAALQLTALQGTTDSVQRSHATWLLHDFADRVYANEEASVDDYAAGAPNCAALPAVVCADYFNSATGARVNASACTTAQMAAFDRWEMTCRYRDTATYQANATAANVRTGSRDFLVAPQFNIAARDSNADAANDSLDVTLSWQGQGGIEGVAGGDAQSARLTVRR